MEQKKKQNKKKNNDIKKVVTKTETNVKALFETSPSNEKNTKKKKKDNQDLISEIEKTLKINVNKIVEEQSKIKEKEYELKTVEKEKYKGIIYLLLGFLFLCLVLMIYTINNTNTRISDLKRTLKEEITETKYVSPTTIFLGDSITYGYDLSKYYKNHNYLNRGYGGYTTSDILDILDEKVLPYHPKKIILLIGTNDIEDNKDTKEIISNIEKIINKIKVNNNNTEIYVESILPINDTDDDRIDHDVTGRKTNSKIKEINKLIKELSNKGKVTYIDTYKDMIDSDGKLNIDYTYEGLHLNDSGYQKLTTLLMEYLK